MADNPNIPNGLVLVAGEPNIQTAIVLATDSTVLGRGDPVKIAAFAAAANGVMVVTRAAAGEAIHGVVMQCRDTGFNYTDTDKRRAASVLTTIQIALTYPGDGLLWRIMASATTDFSATLTASTRFLDADTMADASAVTGDSIMTAALGSLHATEGQFYLMGIEPSYPRTNLVAQDYTKLLVKIANT